MNIRKSIAVIVLTLSMAMAAEGVYAQCAMCAASAENAMKNNKERAKGLNTGILYLLAAPYLLVGGVGVIWYTKYRKKEVQLNLKNDTINLN